MEQIIKQILGDLLFQNAAMQSQLQEKDKRIAELESQIPKKEPE